MSAEDVICRLRHLNSDGTATFKGFGVLEVSIF